MEYITITIAIIGCVLGVLGFFRNSKKDAVDETKDNAQALRDIAKLNIEMGYIKENVSEIRTDMREIKQLFMTYKDDTREIAKEVVQDIVRAEIQKHVEKYHFKEK